MTATQTISSLCQQIHFLTTVLNGRREGEPLPFPDNRQLRVLDRIVTLLTTGTPKDAPKPDADNNTNRIVAVASCLSVHGLRSVIVTHKSCNARTDKNQVENGHVEVSDIAVPADHARRVLDSWNKP